MFCDVTEVSAYLTCQLPCGCKNQYLRGMTSLPVLQFSKKLLNQRDSKEESLSSSCPHLCNQILLTIDTVKRLCLYRKQEGHPTGFEKFNGFFRYGKIRESSFFLLHSHSLSNSLFSSLAASLELESGPESGNPFLRVGLFSQISPFISFSSFIFLGLGVPNSSSEGSSFFKITFLALRETIVFSQASFDFFELWF